MDDASLRAESFEPNSPLGHASIGRDGRDRAIAPLKIEWARNIWPINGEWLIKGLLPASGIASIYGPSRAGKSFLALEWALRLASGNEVLGLWSRHVGIVYVAAEAANGVRKRVRAWLQGNNMEGEDIPFALIGRSVDFASMESPDVQELIGLLLENQSTFAVAGVRLGAIFIDTFACAMPGADENSSADMGAALAALQMIAATVGVVVCVVHHVGKDASKGARGHSSFFAALDAAFELSHHEESGLRQFKVAKQKDDEDGRQWAFRLRPVEIGSDEDGPITSCTVSYEDAPLAPARQKRLTDAQKIVLRALDAVTSNRSSRPPLGVPCPTKCFAALRDDVKQHAFKIGLSKGSEGKSAPRMAWNRALEHLCGQDFIRVYESEDGTGWMWRI